MSTTAWLRLLLAGGEQRARRHRYSHSQAGAPNWQQQQRASRVDQGPDESRAGGQTNSSDSQAEPALGPARVRGYSTTVFRRLPSRLCRHINHPTAPANRPEADVVFQHLWQIAYTPGGAGSCESVIEAAAGSPAPGLRIDDYVLG